MVEIKDVLSMLFTDSEIKTKRVAEKTNKLCDEDLIFCYECPYLEDNNCTINKYLEQ